MRLNTPASTLTKISILYRHMDGQIFYEFLHVCKVQKAPIPQSHVYVFKLWLPRMDGQTDGRTDRLIPVYPPKILFAGGTITLHENW